MEDRLVQERQRIAGDHREVSYYEQAEQWMGSFWDEGSPFPPLFDQLDLTTVIELACGHGRHAEHILHRAGYITLVDVNETNIAACRQRFAGKGRVQFIVNEGNDLPGIADASQTALFCYDAMVHFELIDVLAYLRETKRVLVSGGRAMLHVSNNRENPEGTYNQNRHWRNFGSLEVVRHLAVRAGLRVLAHEVIDWCGEPALDGLLLVEA